MTDTRVRFVEEGNGVLSLLEIETRQRKGLFGRVTDALFALRVQIVRAEARVENGRRLERLWVVEFDGSPIRTPRRLEIQVEVLRAVDGPSRSYITSSRRAQGPSDSAARFAGQ